MASAKCLLNLSSPPKMSIDRQRELCSNCLKIQKIVLPCMKQVSSRSEFINFSLQHLAMASAKCLLNLSSV
jgi:hypothetical protein